MLGRKRRCEDISVLSGSSTNSIQEPRKQNDASLVLNATDTAVKRNPCLKTPKRNKILVLAARRMKENNYECPSETLSTNQGNTIKKKSFSNRRKPLSTIQGNEKTFSNSRNPTSTIRGNTMKKKRLKEEQNKAPSEGIGQTYSTVTTQGKRLHDGKKVRSEDCFKNGAIGLTSFKEVSTDAMTSVSDITMMLSPKYAFRQRESRLQKKRLLNDSASIEFSNGKSSKRRRVQNGGDNHGAPFNSDEVFSSLHHDIAYETIKDYRRANGFLSEKILSSSHYSSDNESDLSTVEDFSVSSHSNDSSQFTSRSGNSTQKSFISDGTFSTSNTSVSKASISSSCNTSDTSRGSVSTYTSSTFELKTYIPPGASKNLTRREKIVSSATDKALKFMDAVADRVCDCLAPNVDSPLRKTTPMSNCTFYRNHDNNCDGP